MLNEKDTKDELTKFELLLLVQSNSLNDLLHKIINNNLSTNLEIVSEYRNINQDIHNFLRFNILPLKNDINEHFNKEGNNKNQESKILYSIKKSEENIQRIITDIKTLLEKIN
jgi:hypothetical protein